MTLEAFYTEVRKHTAVPLLADIDSLENALYAQSLGFDAIATTLNGYTPSPSTGLPNVDLVKSITAQINIPVIAEGGYTTPEQVHQAIENGAWAVCVGTAITNPYLMAKYFIKEGF
jgi:N-acylglucosamine-6-phosphate 2-epimerase